MHGGDGTGDATGAAEAREASTARVGEASTARVGEGVSRT
jgi:hypothetical protein